MECPSCQHVSVEQAAKFCSQCGTSLAAPAPAPETPDGEMEQGMELRDDGSRGKGGPKNQDKPCPDSSWTVQMCAGHACGVLGKHVVCTDLAGHERQSKKKKKKSIAAYDPGSSSILFLTSGSLGSLSLPASVDPALSGGPNRKDGVSCQPPLGGASTETDQDRGRHWSPTTNADTLCDQGAVSPQSPSDGADIRDNQGGVSPQTPSGGADIKGDQEGLSPKTPSGGADIKGNQEGLSPKTPSGGADIKGNQEGLSPKTPSGGADIRGDQDRVGPQPPSNRADTRCDLHPPKLEVRSQHLGLGRSQLEGAGSPEPRKAAGASGCPVTDVLPGARGAVEGDLGSQAVPESVLLLIWVAKPSAPCCTSPFCSTLLLTLRLCFFQANDPPAKPAHDVKGVKDNKNKSKKEKAPATAETQDRTAIPGANTAESKTAQPADDKKKPEGSRTTAAAEKKDKKPSAQKESTGALGSSLSPGEGVMVYFHAIISKNFSFNCDQHQIVIKGGEELGTPKWNVHVCEMNFAKDLGEHGCLVEGSTFISKQHLDKFIPYKYVIVKHNKEEYEFIYKPQQKEGEHVNRCLHIKASLVRSGEWHQYDDIICTRPPGPIKKFWNIFTANEKKSVVNGKQIAAAIMLERVFSILQTWNAINLKSFFIQFWQYYDVVQAPIVYEGGPQSWSSFLQYDEKKVERDLWNYLRKKVDLFLQSHHKKDLPDDWPVRSGLRMGLIALFAVEDWRGFLVNLCRRCIRRRMDCWILTLPVLHHCVGPAPPRKDIPPEDIWAALEGLSYSQFREERADHKSLLSLMEGSQHLLSVDSCLFRSWFSLLPLLALPNYMETTVDYLIVSPARFLDCFLGVYYRLRDLQEISYRKEEQDIIQDILKVLLHLLDANLSSAPEATLFQSYLTVCLKIHEAMCKATKAVRFYEIPALSAEIVCRIISLQPPVESAEAQDNGTERKDSVKMVFQEALTMTKSWLGKLFADRMFRSGFSGVSFSYLKEIEVWRRLVEIPFPEEHSWKEALLEDMEGRIKQEKPLLQISAYCSATWDAADHSDSVTKSFEKCLIEAVSSACQAQTSILDRLTVHDQRKFGTLVSAVVTKSWPLSDGVPVSGLDEVLTHLLTGPDVKELFKLYGMDEKMLANITEDSRQLLDTANSVWTEVVGDLLQGRLTVGQMELILKHKNQFLDIWQIREKSISSQERQHDVEAVLEWRLTELRFLKREKQSVGSLLSLCEKVQHLVKVDFGEIVHKHREVLSDRRLCEVVTVRLPTCSDAELRTHYKLSPEVQEMAEKADRLRDSHLFQMFWEEAAEALREEEEEEDDSEEQTILLEDLYYFLYQPCYKQFTRLYENLKSGDVTLEEMDIVFKDFVNKYTELTSELQVMCSVDINDRKCWIPERVEQIQEYHHLHLAANAAKVIMKVKENLGLAGDFTVLHTLLNVTEDFESIRHEKMSQISQGLIRAKKMVEDIQGGRCQCLEELSQRKEFVNWVQEALGDFNELKVFVDLASISAGENDIDVDRVAYFHDAVQGYASLLYKLDRKAGFEEFMGHLGELWKALEKDPHLPNKLRDSARSLDWLKTVKESHGSVELSSLSLATAINEKGIYVIQAPQGGHVASPHSVLRLLLPESQGPQQVRECSLEELRELLNKLMLMSGKKDQHSTEVEVFSEVFSNVQRLVESFLNLYSAGNLLFRNWIVEVYCSPRNDVSIRMDFNLEPVGQLRGTGAVAELLEALCRQMEHFLELWKDFVAQKRAQHFYLNFYTAEQLVYLSTELVEAQPSQAALVMLSFIKADCTPKDVAEAARRAGGEASRAREQRVTAEFLPSELSLVDKLKAITEQSMVCMNAFLPQCLDLDALGQCLAQLALMSGSPVERHLPRSLQVGQPNLVVCGHSEVLLAALVIYMQAPGQPLPTYDEVLLCTPATTFEEVALLLRRCLTPGSRGRKVYSLLNADQLGYEVGCQAEDLFHQLCLQRHPEDYQLVLVCDSDREHCYLPSAFSQYRVPVTPQASLEDIQTYLASHFQVPLQIPSAAAEFKDRMSVGVVVSQTASVGKSLYVKRLHQKLQRKFSEENVPLNVIRLMDPQVNESQVLGALLPFLRRKHRARPAVFHLDVAASVQSGIWEFLFKLLVLQYLMDVNGKMWLRNQCHLYIVEILEENPALPKRPSKLGARAPQFGFLDIFPKVTCRSPKEVMDIGLHPAHSPGDPGMDPTEFRSETFQRPYQYLKRFYQNQNLDMFQYQEGVVEDTPEECLQHLLIYCGVINPSWSELRNFARFLNYQLRDCEASVFCNPAFTADTLRGFKNFVVTFMIFMARDFATPTLNTSDQSPGKPMVTMDGVREEDLAPFTLRKRWESEPHPYVFFNSDHISMTFIGFHFQPNNNDGVDAINPLSGKVIKKDVMRTDLYNGLLLQRVPFNIDFDQLPRGDKLERLCMALGIQWAIDPDETYELTTDNMLKILAIEMRFRCGIPVVIMGETGCGKTRLIKFLSDLRRGGVEAETFHLVKVHGGTTADMIYSRVREAESIALFNKHQHHLDTILFFDEANTTEAISCIKEVLCDHTVNGKPLAKDCGLHIIAACNPYRKHSREMICRLEAAGLGYRVSAEETTEKLGSIPLRQLVYRVHALPPSLIPLVWDFGQLNDVTEKIYIQQIVQRLVDSLEMEPAETRLITEVLSASQGFMRKRENECSFVSLRDVERCVKVFTWFHEHREMLSQLPWSNVLKHQWVRDPVVCYLVQAIGVCYHASLEKKESYRKAICKYLPKPYDDSKVILNVITQTQDLFLNGVSLRQTIAKNLALKENVFMMTICIELRIPLFLVGKPGSSKSLAKTIVADAMQGPASCSELFRNLKQAHLVSFQCSPHSTPQGIIGTFRQCARFQQDKDLQQYVSVVVLDEVGLAEDSPKMPLKTLHPLLEDGCIEDDPSPHKKVGFISISNWALDPAKMNRGIFVSRGSPNQVELIESAKGICHSDTLVHDRVQGYFAPFAKAYEAVCKNQDKEFFGLRDYYSLIKMVFAAARASSGKPSPRDITQAILRNFSGKDNLDTMGLFLAHLPEARCSEDISTLQLIQENIYRRRPQGSGGEADEADCRYLLVLTQNYAALQILQQKFFTEDQQPEVIFGSSFPKDQEYTQVCRNINRVKICMEAGKMVVLLNLRSLYESLYDALNQYYVYLGGQKYVDLGLGTHRVKCRVHPDFRLIVIEEKEVVYTHFPIPLINRLEKQYLDINTVLEKWQKNIVEELKAWVEKFVRVKDPFQTTQRYNPASVFIGYHSDTCASVVLQVTERLGSGDSPGNGYQGSLQEAQAVLLGCATPDAVVRLGASALGTFVAQSLAKQYYELQQHNSFADFLQAQLRAVEPGRHATFTEITTFSRLLTSHDCGVLESEVAGQAPRPTILSLQQFDTEYSFLKGIRNCLASPASRKILIIQTDYEDTPHGAQLIASAKHSAVNEINKMQGKNSCVLVYFLTKLSRMGSGASYVGFHGGLWQCVHIDDLRRSTVMVADITKLQNVSISQLFEPEDKAGDDAEMRHIGEEEMEMESSEPGEMAEAPGSEGPGPGRREAAPCTQTLDTTRLLRSCVQGAVGMLRDQNQGTRNMRRVEILLGLLDPEEDFRASFLRVCKKHLYLLLKRQESSMFNAKEWVVREASNENALQEAGTFRHTIWKRVQNAVTPLLAQMISFIDRDGNLELLANPDFPPWARDLWMFIFSDIKLLNILPQMNDTRSRNEVAYVVVHNEMKCAVTSVPFSWRISDYLEELWAQAQYITGAEGHSEKLVEIFEQTPLGRFLAELSGQQQQILLHWYLEDFLRLTMSVSSSEELRFLQMALWSCVCQLKAASRRPEKGVSLSWVHLAFQSFRNRLQNFSRILTVCPQVLGILEEAVQTRGLLECEMTLDVNAAVACAEMLTRHLLQPSPQAWLQTVKSLSTPLELLCSEGLVQGCGSMVTALVRELRTQWNRIFSVALFVEHVLLGTEGQSAELRALVTDYTISLNKCLEDNSDIKSHRPFAAIMTTLRKCKDHASKTFSRLEVQPCPSCLADARDPVCLPCDHVFCHGCIKARLILGEMRCPSCLTDLPEDFSLTVSQEHRDAVEKHAQFRQLCNGFFVDLVSTMCFRDNTPPQKDVVEALLALLFVQKTLLREESQRHREHTKFLSPFDDVVDKTPVIRSVVLKLLLKYSFNKVKDYIQDYLSTLEKKEFLLEDKTELYTLVINCLEDSIHEKTSACSENQALSYLLEDVHFLRTLTEEAAWRGGRGPAAEASVGYLQQVARLRLCLNRAADFLFEVHTGSETTEERRRYLQEVERLCVHSGNDWFRVYLVRRLTSQYTVDFVQSLARRGHPAQWVFPKEVIAQQVSRADYPGQLDRFLVYGDGYKALRDAVGKAVLQCNPEGLRATLEACRGPQTQQAVHLLLALFREVAVLYRSQNAALHPRPEQCEAMIGLVEETTILSPEAKNFAKSLVTNTLPLLATRPSEGGLEAVVTEMAVHAAAVLLHAQDRVLEPLRNLAFFPDSMVNAFLPTMPEDLLAQARRWQGLETVQWYACPNGHPCSVGECGKPMQQASCPDCGAPIGGVNHTPTPGFSLISNNTDRTQTGHVLGNPVARDTVVVSDRALSPVVFILLRLLTHLALLLGATKSPQALRNLIKPPVQDPQRFLQQHIQRNVEQLTKMLGKSADETAHLVHLTLRCLLSSSSQCKDRRHLHFDARLSTRELRNSWEKAVEPIISSELEHLDKTLLAVNALISQDERVSSNPVAKIIYGDPSAFLCHLPQKSAVHCSKMWRPRKRVTAEHLQHVVEQKSSREAVPVLWKFLQMEPELRLVKFLPEILALQRNLVKRFQNVSEVKFRSLKDFISSQESDGMKKLFHDKITVFLMTWNQLRKSLETSGELKLPQDYCSTDLDLDAPFEVILPRRRERGLCATALVSYLIHLHNEMVRTVDEFSTERSSYVIDASEVTDLHVISYEPERDLMPLILSNCQYRVEQGGEALQEFDLEKIQRQLTGRFLQGKPRLTLKGIPTLVYRHDRNYEHLFTDIKNKIHQEPLPSAALSTLSGQLQSFSDACEALSVIEVTLGFLSTTGGDANMPLLTYIQDILRMGDQTNPILEALTRCQLQHTIALWHVLSSHKCEQLLRQGHDPFREIGSMYKAELGAADARLLRTFLQQTDLDSFLLELHELIVLKLKRLPTEDGFNPTWPLRVTLVNYMHGKESDIPPELEFDFPEDILLSSCVSVWNMAARLKQARHDGEKALPVPEAPPFGLGAATAAPGPHTHARAVPNSTLHRVSLDMASALVTVQAQLLDSACLWNPAQDTESEGSERLVLPAHLDPDQGALSGQLPSCEARGPVCPAGV
ncbi:PREDICTED: E3 ubiquitin-protein ligase RNF213 [Elephantulus edwardii]|uniref:E3 ubiquitin-protein ligase RNF213 n=1 Tax=Elephantulus edwardii TaxID=28737 RepID=UPI0003F06504|nr:PREDICTED: E3 ubiquitin-protein ligase RNF213 [Elephantulus edwardii]